MCNCCCYKPKQEPAFVRPTAPNTHQPLVCSGNELNYITKPVVKWAEGKATQINLQEVKRQEVVVDFTSSLVTPYMVANA